MSLQHDFQKVHPAYRLAIESHGLPKTHAWPGAKFKLTKRLRFSGRQYNKGSLARLERVCAVKSVTPGLPLFKMPDGTVLDIQLPCLQPI